MAKYFIEFNGGGATLASEKMLRHYIEDKYEHTLVSQSAIDSIVEDLKGVVENYMFLHKMAKPISVSAYKDPMEYKVTHICAGKLYMTLKLVRREIPDTSNR